MKLLNWCKKYRNKLVQLTIASIIISHTHAPLRLCIVATNCIAIAMTLMVIITICGATIQSWSGAWVWLIIILAIVSCTGLFLCFLYQFSNFIHFYTFTPVQLCTLLNFFGEKYLYGLVYFALTLSRI